MHVRHRLLVSAALSAAFLVVTMVALQPRRRPHPRASESLSITAEMDRCGRGGGSVPAPEVSIVAPDGRTAGFRRPSGSDEHDLPHAQYGHATGGGAPDVGRRFLSLSAPDDETYRLEVTGTAAGRYRLAVRTVHFTRGGLVASTTRELRDVPISEGALHRYDVVWPVSADAAPLRLSAADAPAPQPPAAGESSFPRVPPRLHVAVGSACGGGPPRAVRVLGPDGRAHDAEPAEPLAETRSRDVRIPSPADGEYVVEISGAATPAPYSLFTSFAERDTMHTASFTSSSSECDHTTVAPGETHRWIFRLRHDGDVPLRLIERPLRIAPERER